MNVFQKFVAYLQSSKEEMKKVSWPSRQDTLRYSALVIGVSICMAAFFAALDLGFTKLVDLSLTQRIQETAEPVQPTNTPTQPTTSSAPVFDFTDVEPIIVPTSTGGNQ